MVFVLDAEYKIKVVPGTVTFQTVPFRSFSRLGVEYVFSLTILHLCFSWESFVLCKKGS